MKFKTEGPLIITPELQEKINRSLNEPIKLVEYDPNWKKLFLEEKDFIQSQLPTELILKIEHFGSTAIHGMQSKPVIDIMVEVSNLNEAHSVIPETFEPLGYDYFPRPAFNNGEPPLIPFLIKWKKNQLRSHHIYFLDSSFTSYWDRLSFRDYLMKNPTIARDYQKLKIEESIKHSSDRISYTNAKTEFIERVTALAKKCLST
jgi:GrpB-like predicted nucleotidyltransferase (UPF0157 family)